MSLVFSRSSRWIVPALLAASILVSCKQSPESATAKYISTGKDFLRRKDTTRAILQFRNAVKTSPKNAEAYYQLGLAYLAAMDVRSGITAFRRAVELNPKHHDAQLQLARLMSVVDDPAILQNAEQRLRDLLQDKPQDPDALHALALTELKLGDETGAVQDLQKAIGIAPQQVVLAATLAQVKLEHGDVPAAEAVLQKACADSHASSAHVILGRLYASEKRWTEAEQQYKTALSLRSDYGPAIFNLGVLQDATDRKQEAEASFRRLSMQSDPDVNYIYGVYLFQQNRRDEAVQEFARLARQNPDDRAARTRLIVGYEATNRQADAEKILTAILKKNPHDLEGLLQRGEFYLNAGKLADADADFHRVLQLRPDSAEIHFALARLHEARGEKMVQRQELNESLKWDPSILPVRLALAQALLRDNEPQAALEVLDKAPSAQKDNVTVQEARNWALLQMNKYAEAREGIERGLHIQRTPAFLLQDATVKLAAKDYAGARAAANEAFHGNPRDVRALQVVTATYLEQKQGSQIFQKIGAFAASSPESPEAQFYLGELLSRAKRFDEARQAFSAAKAANPDFTAADLAIAQLDANAGKWEDARKRAAGLVAAHPGDLNARLFVAQIDIQNRDYPSAARDYRGLVQDYPANIFVLNNLAYSLAETGSYDEALKYSQHAKELAPDRADVNDTLGWVMYRKGIYGSAIQYLKASVSRQNTALGQYHLAMAYFKSGNLKLGQEALQTGRRINPDLPEATLTEQLSTETAGSSK